MNREMVKGGLNVLEFKGVDTLRYKLHGVKNLNDMKAEMGRMLGNRIGILKPSSGRRFVTFGSCFAENVAEALKERGADVYVNCIVEDVNSPLNNMDVLYAAFYGTSTHLSESLRSISGVDYSELKHRFRKATDIIFTLGNVFYRVGNKGERCLESKLPLGRETYNETVAGIQLCINTLRNHTNAAIYVSVSPVPISGYRGTEFASAIEADCASKSQLRSALQQCSGFTYIPTFEFFRWLPAHQEFSTFGADNGHARHIHKEQINAAMELLCR